MHVFSENLKSLKSTLKDEFLSMMRNDLKLGISEDEDNQMTEQLIEDCKRYRINVDLFENAAD